MTVELAANAADWLSGLQHALGLEGKTAVAILQIIGIDILLSGDNAVVIALACRSLPASQRSWGIALGVVAAVVLRLVFAVTLQAVLKLPWLALAGGILLLMIAIQLAVEGDRKEKDIAPAKTLWGAVWTIALADLVTSLDNVLAIAGAANGDPWLILFGLALSIPLIIFGATLIIGVLARYPVLVWAGAALLGWVAGGLIGREPKLQAWLTSLAASAGLTASSVSTLCEAAAAVLVVFAGMAILALRRLRPTDRIAGRR